MYRRQNQIKQTRRTNRLKWQKKIRQTNPHYGENNMYRRQNQTNPPHEPPKTATKTRTSIKLNNQLFYKTHFRFKKNRFSILILKNLFLIFIYNINYTLSAKFFLCLRFTKSINASILVM